MTRTLFTAAGCVRCNLAKKFMRENAIGFEEHDATGQGKDLFVQFYRENRGAIFRGKEGIEFPVLADGTSIRQGVAVVIAHLHAGAKLDGFVGRSSLSKGWVGGLHVSGGDPAQVVELTTVLAFLKRNGMKLELDTNGKNASVLETLLVQGLGDRVIMDLKGSQALYGRMLGEEIDASEIEHTMELVTRFCEYRFRTTLAPVHGMDGDPGKVRTLTPEEIEETARWLKEATGSDNQPYVLRLFDPESCTDKGQKAAEKTSSTVLFRYRAAARRHQIRTELEKSPG